MATAFLTFFDKAEGESTQKGKEKWIELQGWTWEVEAETSWTKGGGASVGKPSPGKLNWEHTWDRSAHVILGYICTGSAFDKAYLTMCKSMVFKALCIKYYQQGGQSSAPGAQTAVNEFYWDIPLGKSETGGLPGATYKPG